MSNEETGTLLFPFEEDIPEKYRIKELVVQREYLIGGELRVWNGDVQGVISPVRILTEEGLSVAKIGSYPRLSGRESREALNAAVAAYRKGTGAWPAMRVGERIECVEEFLRGMSGMKEEIVLLLMWEIGKTYNGAVKEFERTVSYIENTIEALREFEERSSMRLVEENFAGRIRREPLGVVLCIGPFNYPLYETFTTVIPALLMGNTVVFKPPRCGVLLHRSLLNVCRECFPAGVVNSIYGEGAEILPPVMSSGLVDVLAFTGSSKVANLLKGFCPKLHRTRSILGLEAKNPAIVLPDADIGLAVSECAKGALAFNGQRCTALKILFVHSRVATEFVAALSERIENLKCGMPWDKDVFITPMPDTEKVEYLSGVLDDSTSKGAEIVNRGGGSVAATFFSPALVFPVKSDMRIFHEEQFGPIVPVVPFDDIESPVRYCIESNYGQQASIFGRDAAQISQLANVLVKQVGRVNINCKCQRGPDVFPFSGRKDSGEGTLSIADGLRAFSMRTVVAAKDKESNKEILECIVREGRSKFLS